MQSFLSLLGMGKAGERASADAVEEAAALLASCPTNSKADLERWAEAVAPHFAAFVRGPQKDKDKAKASSTHSRKGHGLELVALPRAAVAQLLASDKLVLEDEYHAYLFAAAHAELHALQRYQSEHSSAITTTTGTGTGTGSSTEGTVTGSAATDLRGSDALYGQFTSGALKLLAGQRTDTSSQQSEAETHDDEDSDSDDDRKDTDDDDDDDGAGDPGDEQEEDANQEDEETDSDAVQGKKQHSLNLRGTAGLYQHMSQGVLKSKPSLQMDSVVEQSQDADPSEALVAEWLAKEQQDKQAKSEPEHKSESKEAEATEEEKKEVSEKPVKKTRGRKRTGADGKARRGQKGRAQKRQDKNKAKESDDEEEVEDADLRRFRDSEECYSYMREVMVELEPHIRFPLIAPHWLIKVERDKLVTRTLLTEAYRHQALMQMGDTAIYAPPKSNVRMKSRNYVNAILWDATRHGLHIKVSKDGRVAKKQQSHWYSVAVGKDGYELGKHHWAIKVGGDETYIGVVNAQCQQLDNYLGADGTSMYYNMYGNVASSCATPVSSYLPPFKKGDVIGVLLDMDKKELSFYKNNVALAVAFRNIPAAKWYPAVGWRAGAQTLVDPRSTGA